MVNKVILIGHIGRDPEIKRLESGSVVASFSVATSENYRDKNGEWQTLTEWHNVSAWGKLAEKAESSAKKGVLVYVEGRLQTRSWENTSGEKRYKTEIKAEYFRTITKPEALAMAGNGSEHATGGPSVADAGAVSGQDEDLPF